MAEEAKTEEAAPKGGKGKLIMMIVFVGFALGGWGLAGFAIMKAPPHENKEAKKEAKDDPMEESKEDKEKAKEERAPRGQLVNLSPIIVNLVGSHGTRYLKVSISMETSSTAVVSELQELTVPLTDMLIGKLSDAKIEEIDNSKGRNRLKRELMESTNEMLKSGYVSKFYFSEFLVQ